MRNDMMIHGMLCDRALRFAAIDGTELVRTAQKTHGLSLVATAALGRQLMMTSVAASLCKNDTDTVTTVLAGSGPSGNIVCVGRHGGLVKGYATNPEVELPLRADGKLDVRGYVGTSGKLTLIRDLGLVPGLLSSRAVILGVSAGSMNMGRYVAEIWESKAMYEGLGLTDITVKGHYTEDTWFRTVLQEISRIEPVAVMEDESAIFIKADAVWKIGNIHWIDKGEIRDWYSSDVPDM